MSEEDREKLLRLRGMVTAEPNGEPVTLIAERRERRPMTEAEEKMIAAALELGHFWQRDVENGEQFCEARAAVQRERTNQSDVDELIAAKQAVDAACERLRAAKLHVAPDIQNEEYKKRGWR